MQFTLRQARTALATYAHDHSTLNLVASINDAVLSLSSYDAWARLRKVMRLKIKGPYFSLPQDAASVVRACVNGIPTSVLGQEYRFLSSGPGDLSTIPTGFHFLDPGVIDLGVFPTMRELREPSYLVAYLSDTANSQQPDLVVTGHTESGELRTFHLTPARREAVLDSVEFYVTDCKLVDVTSVVIDGAASAYINLYATPAKENLWKDADTGYDIGKYHPEIIAPEFHRYMIPGLPEGKSVELLCEVRINPLPLVDDNDVLPFSSLEPVKYAMMANRYFTLGEIDAGIKYRDLAAQMLMQADKTEEKKQSFVVENMLYANSMGEMSDQYSFL